MFTSIGIGSHVGTPGARGNVFISIDVTSKGVESGDTLTWKNGVKGDIAFFSSGFEVTTDFSKQDINAKLSVGPLDNFDGTAKVDANIGTSSGDTGLIFKFGATSTPAGGGYTSKLCYTHTKAKTLIDTESMRKKISRFFEPIELKLSQTINDIIHNIQQAWH